jgi:voltage-gated potassium channel
MTEEIRPPAPLSWRERTRVVIFEAETPAGKTFDVALLVVIVLSIVAVMLESVEGIRTLHGPALRVAEWVFTGLFTVEYVLRLACVGKPIRYATSFFGIVDLLAIVPTYLSVLLPGSQSLIVIRSLRLLRIFRIFKLGRFLSEANILLGALRSGSRKVMVFLGSVAVLVVILGSTMYLVEGAENGFTSVPVAMYWAVVTMTTVGYGDVVPQTVAGKLLSSLVMIIGYSIIAIPTGIMTAEIVRAHQPAVTTRQCPECLAEGHSPDARFCKYCGAPLGAPN